MHAPLLALLVLAPILPAPATPASGAVDPSLVGTWKLELPGAPIYWVVRPDGVYRVHGPGAPARQFGRMDASKGRWSVKSAVWADEGSYKLADATTWIVTGRGGTGTWRRVWVPAAAGGQAAGPGACRLVAPSEVARALGAPAAGGVDGRVGPDGCVFRSQLSSLDQLAITTRQNQARFFQNNRKGKMERAIDVPGVGDQAYAEALTGGELTLHFLKGMAWVTLRLRLTPDAAMEDLPYLSDVARAAAGRL